MPAPPKPRHHWLRIALLTVVGLVILAGGYTVLRYAFRSHPGAKSIDAAVDDLRASSSLDTSNPTGFVRPAPGIYTAAGEGSEHISSPPNSQDDGALMPITVRYLPDGCWNWHIDYNSAHWHEFDYCPKGTELLLVAQRNFQSWDFGAMKVDNLGPYTCDPPAPIVVEDPQPGQTFEHHCTGENSAAPGPSTSAGPSTIVGTETLDIGGVQVPAIHQTRAQQMTGAQVGDVTEDWWFAADNGLPLRAKRRYKLDTQSVIGRITYTEQGSWQLTSLEPRT
jgi:hypothetical protein